MATFSNIRHNTVSASLINSTNIIAQTALSGQSLTLKKSASITELDTTGISAANACITGTLTSAFARITSLSSSNFYFDKGFTTINPALSLAVTASLGNVQSGIVSIQNQGVAPNSDFVICVEAAKISSVSSVINTSFVTSENYGSGIELFPRVISIETGKFNYGIFVKDNTFSADFALHFTIVN